MSKLVTLVFVLAAVSTADAKPKPKGAASVQVHMDNAAKAHKAGKFDVALEELKAAYAIDPQPKLLYAIAQVYAKLDDCENAIDNYEKFLATTKDKSKQTVVKQAIDACQKKVAEKPGKTDAVFRAKKPDAEPETKPVEPKVEAAPVEPKVETPPPPPEPAPAPSPPPSPIRAFGEPPPVAKPAPAPIATTTHSPWYHDAIGDVLVLGGIGAGVASYLVLRGAQSDLDKAEQATTLGDYTDLRDSADKKQIISWALAGGGVALITAGVLHYALRDDRRETHAIAIVPTEHGGLITWSGGL